MAATKTIKAIAKSKALRAWLDSIKSANRSGLLKTSEVVKAARDPDSPGHRYFTWDDSKAAAKYRLEEAERLIRRVYLVTDDGTKQPAFLSLLPDREKPGGGYRATSEVISSKALREQLKLTATAELRAWTERYQMLTDLVGPVAKAARIELPKRRRVPK